MTLELVHFIIGSLGVVVLAWLLFRTVQIRAEEQVRALTKMNEQLKAALRPEEENR
ncbi:hypothetical protein WG922_17430 [Ramlibacter sp. AN1015]|uniref:hypothetical protein n=1 Tax=Ramlibacter sp. AN1015 TaxID=3133428 RepID=UPI0030BF0A6B